MYIPRNFRETDESNLLGMIEKHPFATLITHTDEGIEANHIPLYLQELEDKICLQGHIAKANPLWKKVKDSSDVLVIFNGPNCYISPNYYPSKQENGRAVPTWNYVAVHVKGTLRYIQDSEWKLTMLNNLTDQHEANQEKPWSVNDAPDMYIEKMLPAIVGIEIEVTAIDGKWKVSQNQSEQNIAGVIDGLSTSNAVDASKMIELIKEKIEA